MPEDMTEIKKESGSSSPSITSGPGYPWGTRLHFEDDLIEELGVESLAVGDIVKVSGFAVVESKGEHSDEDGTDRNISIQMTFIKVDREESDRAQQLYGG